MHTVIHRSFCALQFLIGCEKKVSNRKQSTAYAVLIQNLHWDLVGVNA